MKLKLFLVSALGLFVGINLSPAATLVGVESISFTNTRADWFFIEELDVRNTGNTDVASSAFGATATVNSGPAFGSTVAGGIDDIFGNCCGTGWHSGTNVGGEKYTVSFPGAQSLTGNITVWNRQDACCPERLDGFLVEYWSGADGTGSLVGSQQVDGLATNSGGGISTATGASFAIVPEPSAALLALLGIFGLSARRRHA
jgi:hypothetical protein